MKYEKIVKKYDEVYSKDETAFGGEPLPLVVSLAEYIHKGSVLEIGAGAGRNSLFLAKRGLDVVATDISPVSVALMQKRAAEQKISMRTEVLDAFADALPGDFDAIICTFTLHHLDKVDALEVIKKIQQHTRSGGLNALTVFTKDGAFYRNNPTTSHFYLDNREELESLYAGWTLHKSFEREGPARDPDAGGNKQFNTFAGLLAQKPRGDVILP